jgi:hypothetical protein
MFVSIHLLSTVVFYDGLGDKVCSSFCSSHPVYGKLECRG